MATKPTQAVPKLYDVILWLMGRVEKFPRSQKFTLGDRIVNSSNPQEYVCHYFEGDDLLTALREGGVSRSAI